MSPVVGKICKKSIFTSHKDFSIRELEQSARVLRNCFNQTPNKSEKDQREYSCFCLNSSNCQSFYIYVLLCPFFSAITSQVQVTQVLSYSGFSRSELFSVTCCNCFNCNYKKDKHLPVIITLCLQCFECRLFCYNSENLL